MTMHRLFCQEPKQNRLKMLIVNASVVLLNTSMIVLDFDVCPTLILAAILGEVLRFAMGAQGAEESYLTVFPVKFTVQL